MKKILALCAACALLLTVVPSCAKRPQQDWEKQPAARLTGESINVFNWGEYIDDEVYRVNEAFTHETGIKVNYKTFDTNESLYTMLKNGADYDVIVPSDYMVSKMASEGMLATLNFDNIPNYQYIDPTFQHLEFDPNDQYSVPYLWSTMGIFYNKQYVSEADLAEGWGLLWDAKYQGKILMIDNERDAFAIALRHCGFSMNSTNPDEWQQAYNVLAAQKPLLGGYVMDQVYNKIGNEEAWIAPYYAGDANIMMYADDSNPNIGFFVPDEGTNIFLDNLCVPASSKHQAAAEAYINFLCSTPVALANTVYVGYSTPQLEARAALDASISGNPIFYPPQSVIDNAEWYTSLPPSIYSLQDSLWNKLKAL
ncbi:MAG: ABC transporter substrate-binding protein [Oscillospiraceae bacterium]|nr:ABC transporter substrate-binding protein [Oscillospiraceae bacterium]